MSSVEINPSDFGNSSTLASDYNSLPNSSAVDLGDLSLNLSPAQASSLLVPDLGWSQLVSELDESVPKLPVQDLADLSLLNDFSTTLEDTARSQSSYDFDFSDFDFSDFDFSDFDFPGVGTEPTSDVQFTRIDLADVGSAPKAPSLGDLDGDGDLDLVYSNRFADPVRDVRILMNDGQGNFTLTQQVVLDIDPTITAEPISTAIADFDGQNGLDIAYIVNGVAAESGLYILFNDGSGSFDEQGQAFYETGYNPQYVEVGEFNGDSSPDLAVAIGSDDRIDFYFNNGDGSFTRGPQVKTGSGPWQISVGDLNGDRRDDLLVTNAVDNSFTIIVQGRNGTLEAVSTLSSNGIFPYGSEIVDVNSDGRPDIVIANADGDGDSNDTESNISVFRAGGQGWRNAELEFSLSFTYLGGPSAPKSVSATEFNGDQFPDLIVADAGDVYITPLVNQGDGTFAPLDGVRLGPDSDTYIGGNANDVVVGDLDGKGRLDFVMTRNGNVPPYTGENAVYTFLVTEDTSSDQSNTASLGSEATAFVQSQSLASLEDSFSKLEQDLEQAQSFVADQETELRWLQQSIEYLEMQLQRDRSRDRDRLEASLAEVQERYALLDQTLIGQRQRLQAKATEVAQQKQVLQQLRQDPPRRLAEDTNSALEPLSDLLASV